MTVLLEEFYEGGSSGANITTGNSAFTTIVGTMTFDNSTAIEGSQSGNIAVGASTAYGRVDFTAVSTFTMRYYVSFAAVPAAITYFSSLNSGATARAQVRINTDGTISIRNGATVVGTTTAVVNTAQWYRIEWVVDNNATTQQLKLFDLHSVSPVSGGDTGAVSYNQGTFDNIRVGPTASSTIFLNFDAVRCEDTNAFIGPLANTPSPWIYGYDIVIG